MCCLCFLFLVLPYFQQRITGFGLHLHLPCQGCALAAVQIAPNLLARTRLHMTASWGGRGEVGDGENCAVQGICVWAGYSLALSVCLLAARGQQHCYLGRAHRWAVSTGGCVLSCCHAPEGPGEPNLPAPG